MNNGFNQTNTNPLMQNQQQHPQYNTFSDPNAGAPRHDIENGMGGQPDSYGVSLAEQNTQQPNQGNLPSNFNGPSGGPFN